MPSSQDDNVSVISFREGLREEWRGAPPMPLNWGSNAPRPPVSEVLRVDGKVPDVVYKLEYIGWDNSVLTTKQSTRAFKHIPDVKGFVDGQAILAEDDDNDSDNGDEEKVVEAPVIEILTKVFSRRRPARPIQIPQRRRMPRRTMNTDQPITSVFDQSDYNRYSDYSSDEDDVDVSTGNVQPAEPVMVVHSEPLRNAIKAVVAYYPHARLSGDPLTIPSPYRILYHHRRELADYRENQPAAHSPEYAATTASHIDVLLEFLDSNSNGQEIRREEELHQLEIPMATYDYFWLLLKPGEIVYAKRYDIWTPFVISNVSGGPDAHNPSSSSNSYRIDVWHLESNGTRVDRFMNGFNVAPWHGEQAIDSLSVIPAAFWKEDLEAQGGLSMRQKSIAEGKQYWELLKSPVYMEYDGLLVNSWTGASHASGLTGFMCGRVICDAAGFAKYYHQAPDQSYPPPRMPYRGGRRNQAPPPIKDHLPKTLPLCGCEVCTKNRVGSARREFNSPYVGFEDLDPLTDSPPLQNEDIFYMVLSNTIPGFVLGHRRWGHLNVAHLKPVKTDKEAFKYLVLEDEVKMTVKALIGKFATTVDGSIAPWGNDFVKNKGEGRIFLLHGSPGVGKTCTAECIAELTNRPLISLTSGDLSIDSYRVEQNLSYFFELGQRYGALVLLDEADVYLERRRSKDIARNGLVSIFLRALEYYRGLLIITTNRVQSFDGAFLSRIHVALHYRNLANEDRERIWTNNFDRLDRDSAGRIRVSVAAREFVWSSREVRSLQWNGREIRNAMQTALALAESDAQEDGTDTVTLSEKHIRAVVKLSKGFRDFVKHSMPADDVAYDAYEDSDDEDEDDGLDRESDMD